MNWSIGVSYFWNESISLQPPYITFWSLSFTSNRLICGYNARTWWYRRLHSTCYLLKQLYLSLPPKYTEVWPSKILWYFMRRFVTTNCWITIKTASIGFHWWYYEPYLRRLIPTIKEPLEPTNDRYDLLHCYIILTPLFHLSHESPWRTLDSQIWLTNVTNVWDCSLTILPR